LALNLGSPSANTISGRIVSRVPTCTIDAANDASIMPTRACFTCSMLIRNCRNWSWITRHRPACSRSRSAHSGGGPCALRCARITPKAPAPSTTPA